MCRYLCVAVLELWPARDVPSCISRQMANNVGTMLSPELLLARLDEYIAVEASPVSGRLPPERELANRLGVSRAELRKALHQLETKGTVSRQVGRGTFLTARSESISDVASRLTLKTSPPAAMQARLLIEPELAALAATMATPEQIQHMRRLCDETRACRSWANYAELDWRLHNLIGEATGNVLLAEMQQILNRVRRSVVWGDLETPPPGPSADYHSYAEHEAVVAAIVRRDPETAAEAMREHLESTRRLLLRGRRI